MIRALLTLSIVLFSACGKQKFPDYGADDPVIFKEVSGNYAGDFVPLNTKARSRIKVSALIWIKDEQIYAKVNLERGLRDKRYQQYIHKGSRCPGLYDDLNKDGMVDMTEALIASGEILIPLDGFIEGYKKGGDWYPATNRNGNYFYSRSGSVSKMLKDMYQQKVIREKEPLALDQRVLIIYGSARDPLLPVACAILKEQYF